MLPRQREQGYPLVSWLTGFCFRSPRVAAAHKLLSGRVALQARYSAVTHRHPGVLGAAPLDLQCRARRLPRWHY
jgi:hypothetical protein